MMSEFLDRVRADLAAATLGPWRAVLFDGVDYDDGSSSYRGGIYPAYVGAPPIIFTNSVDRLDATLIASAPDRLDRMERALRGVMEMHRPEPQEVNTVDDPVWIMFCRECGLEWGDDGCPTVTEIKEELSDE